eukprot:2225619-Karenia_brevis.AAC.1
MFLDLPSTLQMRLNEILLALHQPLTKQRMSLMMQGQLHIKIQKVIGHFTPKWSRESNELSHIMKLAVNDSQYKATQPPTHTPPNPCACPN